MAMIKRLQILNDLYTVFLFTKADIGIALIPVVRAIYHLCLSIPTLDETLFAVAAAPLSSPIRLIDTMLWIWLHLLQFNVANQIKAPEEDKINKPSRPIPAGRITIHNATILRWALVPICLAYSALYSPQVMWVSLPMLLFTTWYNEHDGDKESFSKNFLTAVLYGLSELGGTLVAGHDHTQISPTGRIAAEVTVAVFLSTLHAQDFRDASGDRMTGRRTFPILYPVASRVEIGLAIPLWSIFLSLMWQLDWLCASAFIAYGHLVGARFVLYRTVAADRLSCKYYGLWFSLHHLFPAYWYYFHSADEFPGTGFIEKIIASIVGVIA